jgi:VIT1/CCC1 family predicted Fe2+/Mn2+ transporter
MPQSPHIERHFTAGPVVRDIVIGMSDGLTVPFALAAGLSGAVTNNSVIITAGLAEVAAGAIAMGLGGYLATRGDIEHFHAEKKREEREVEEIPHMEEQEVRDIFLDYGLHEASINSIIEGFKANPHDWVRFMMRFELGLEEPDPRRAIISAFTIGLAYIAGGIVPLVPYFLFKNTQESLFYSVCFTMLALLVFGYVKGAFTGSGKRRGAIQTLVVGGLAAGAAFFIAKLLS